MQFWPKQDGCCCGGCEIEVTVLLCSDDSLASGAVVTVYDDEDNEIGSDTTDGSGVVSIDIPAAGDYVVTVAKAGYSTVTSAFTASCPKTERTIYLGSTLHFFVRNGFLMGVPAATITVTGPGVSAVGLTDPFGLYILPVPTKVTSHSYSITTTDFSIPFATTSGTMDSTCGLSPTNFTLGSTSPTTQHLIIGTAYCPYLYPDLMTCTGPLGTVPLFWSTGSGLGAGWIANFGAYSIQFSAYTGSIIFRVVGSGGTLNSVTVNSCDPLSIDIAYTSGIHFPGGATFTITE